MKTSNYTPESQSYKKISTSTSLSKDVLHLYGISRSVAMQMVYHHWNVDPEYRTIFSSFYLLHWSESYFNEKLADSSSPDTIEREGVEYSVIYYKTMRESMPGSAPRQLLLSFRDLKEEYDAQSVVLVTVS